MRAGGENYAVYHSILILPPFYNRGTPKLQVTNFGVSTCRQNVHFTRTCEWIINYRKCSYATRGGHVAKGQPRSVLHNTRHVYLVMRKVDVHRWTEHAV